MTYEQARIDVMTVIAQVVADHTAYPLVVESSNRAKVDQSLQTNPYLKVEIDYLPGGGQLDLGNTPNVRQVGQICLYTIAKGGSGEAEAAKLMDFVRPYFDCKRFGQINCHAAMAIRSKDIQGWWWVPMLTDFWFVRSSA